MMYSLLLIMRSWRILSGLYLHTRQYRRHSIFQSGHIYINQSFLSKSFMPELLLQIKTTDIAKNTGL